MAATGIGVIGPDDLARAVDAGRNGAVGGQGVVEDGVGVDWHLVSFRESVDRKAEPFSNSLGLNCSRRARQHPFGNDALLQSFLFQRGASGGCHRPGLKRAAAWPEAAVVTRRHRTAFEVSAPPPPPPKPAIACTS